MSKVVISGASTGTGTFTIESPATNTDRVITLPDAAGTIETDATLIRTSVVSSLTYEVAASDRNLYVDASSNAVTITLPALSLGRRITVRASNVTNAITIQRAGSDTIVGLTSVTLSSVGDFWTFEGGPNRWELVDGHETISGTNDGIKRADGTMEQWKGSLSLSGGTAASNAFGTTSGSFSLVSYAVTFNKVFTAAPFFSVSSTANRSDAVAAVSATGANGDIWGGTAATARWYAIGRWYA